VPFQARAQLPRATLPQVPAMLAVLREDWAPPRRGVLDGLNLYSHHLRLFFISAITFNSPSSSSSTFNFGFHDVFPIIILPRLRLRTCIAKHILLFQFFATALVCIGRVLCIACFVHGDCTWVFRASDLLGWNLPFPVLSHYIILVI